MNQMREIGIGALILLGVLLATTLVFNIAWNYVLPLFGLPELNFPQAFFLLLLIAMIASLFKSQGDKTW